MGVPMAGHLVKAGHSVTVFNRTRAKADAWAAKYGGNAAATPAEAAKEADAVLACVGNDDDLAAVTLGTNGAFDAMTAGGVFVDHKTVLARIERRLADEVGARGVLAVDAPEAGGRTRSEAGQSV